MRKKSHISLRARKTNVTFRPLLCFHLLLATQLLTKQKIQVEEERNWSEWVDSVLGIDPCPKSWKASLKKKRRHTISKQGHVACSAKQDHYKWQYRKIIQKEKHNSQTSSRTRWCLRHLSSERLFIIAQIRQVKFNNNNNAIYTKKKEIKLIQQFAGYQGKRTTKLYQIFESALKMAVNVIAQVFAISPPKFTRNGRASKPRNFNIYFRFPKEKRKHKHLRRRQKRKVQNLSCGSALRVTQVRSIWASNNLPRPWPK